MLYVAIATRAFRRYSTYRAATLAGIFTNSVFGVIYSFAYLALWDANPTAGGYDATDAVTYVWLGQALLMTVALWGGGTTDDLAERIRTGDVAIDLYRPVGLVGWYLASDLGRAAYHFLTRGHRSHRGRVRASSTSACPRRPSAALGFAVSLVLAVVVSFTIRFLVASSAFWLLDQSGVKVMSGAFAIFFSGMMLPLVLFPGWLGTLAHALPWAAYVQVPADIWLGKHTGADLARRARLPGRLGRRAPRLLPRRRCARRRARWWSRVADLSPLPALGHLRTYGQIAWLWIRAAWQYPRRSCCSPWATASSPAWTSSACGSCSPTSTSWPGSRCPRSPCCTARARSRWASPTPRSAASSGSATTCAPAASTR